MHEPVRLFITFANGNSYVHHKYLIAGVMYSVVFVTIYFVVICTGEVLPPKVVVFPV